MQFSLVGLGFFECFGIKLSLLARARASAVCYSELSLAH